MGEDSDKVNLHRISIGFLFVIGAGLMAPVGALLGTLWSKETTEMVPLSLAFAAGVLIWVAVAGIHVEALESFQTRHDELARFYTLLCIIFGVLAGELLDYSMHRLGFNHSHSTDTHLHRRYPINQMLEIDDGSQEDDDRVNTIIEERMISGNSDEKENDTELGINITSPMDTIKQTTSSSIEKEDSLTENGSAGGNGRISSVDCNGTNISHIRTNQISKNKELSEQDRKQMMEVSTVTCIAVTIHNFPEGLATFASGVAHPKLGFLVAVAVALHNLPLGIAVGMPVYIATGSRWKCVIWATACGLSAILGGLIGLAVIAGGMSGNITGILFGFTIGIMLWTAFKELIPQAKAKDPDNKYTFYLIFIGFVVMDLSMIVLDVVGNE